MEAINSTVSIIKGLEFDMALDLVIKGALDNAIGANSPKLFVTGYAQFFNAETTQCNNVTFCIWENPTKNHTCPLLTQDLRRDMNDLTNLLNAKVSAAIQRAISNEPLDDPSYEDVDPDTCLDEAKASGDWGRLAVCYMARAKRDNPELEPEPRDDPEAQDLGSWITPNQLARIFHPKIGGHHSIAEHVVRRLN
ncbi:putative esterase family protein [Phaeomoniella chlamydospora]|uniref:Putative esterase family protein n=1 Tax=Phaeomoniella chlamydospora TaxID=158046 RepID=A0A0G2E8M6_PHACM|nr:putative esterase family protein [Phaeomoniella chlamydospora]